MKYRTFPKLPDLKLSQFGMGLMRLPCTGDDKSLIDTKVANEMVDIAIAGGVNYFDTAYPYHGGDSERFTSECIVPKMKEHNLHIATKLPQWMVKETADYDKYLNEQLEKLGLEQIEFYLIHALGDENWEKNRNLGIIDFVKRAVADGRIKYPCFSYHGSLNVYKEIIDSYDGWIMTQIMLNYVDENWQAGLEGMKYAYSKNIGTVIMEPLKGGALVNQLTDKVSEVFKQKNLSPLETAMHYCYDFSEATVILSGTSNIDQIVGQVEIAKTADIGKLTSEEKEVIAIAKANFNLIPCSSCQYCQPCPFNVCIPDILNGYNSFAVFGHENAKKQYKELYDDGEGADQCTECGICETLCPQKIDIIEKLKISHEALME